MKALLLVLALIFTSGEYFELEQQYFDWCAGELSKFEQQPTNLWSRDLCPF